MVETILYISMVLIILSQVSLYIYIGSEFKDLKNELIRSGKIEFRNFVNKTLNTMKDDRI